MIPFAFTLIGLSCLFLPSWLGLLLGISFSIILGNPMPARTKSLTPQVLQTSIVALGFGMNLNVVAKVGASGFLYTLIGIAGAMVVGYALGKLLKVDSETSALIGVGTAICGGSAVAAIAPVIKAKPQSISISLGTVFLLNAVALFIFPPIGHFLGLDETQFGLWSALAVHDTSSVVGTSLQYGQRALEVGTTVKLARALWILPLALGFGLFWKSKDQAGQAKKPWFILGFVLASALVTWIPNLQEVGAHLAKAGKHLLVVALFLIGSGISVDALKKVGLRPLLQGVLLWFAVGSSTLAAIYFHWIKIE